MYVCMYVNVFRLTFLLITAPRILKYGTNIAFVSLSCDKENLPVPAYSSIYVSICFLSDQSLGHLSQNLKKKKKHFVLLRPLDGLAPPK